MAIVRIFETGRATGGYSAVAVLDDGAGISYGVSQFTHRSGALAKVAERYLASESRENGEGRGIIADALPLLKKRTAAAVKAGAADEKLKAALRAAGLTQEMREAQDEIAERLYLQPAINACGEMGFTKPLSLAVVHDSLVQGSWERLRRGDAEKEGRGETEWIVDYVRRRDAWLKSVKRLAVTRYRTQFFLSQIAAGNWGLKLPVTVHGVRLTCAELFGDADKRREGEGENAGPPQQTAVETAVEPQQAGHDEPSADEARPPVEAVSLEQVGSMVSAAADKFDRVEDLVETVATRAETARALWSAIASAAWQTVWGVVGFAAGVPRGVWLAIAVFVSIAIAIVIYRTMSERKA